MDSDFIFMIAFNELLALVLAYITYKTGKAYGYFFMIFLFGILNLHFGIGFIAILAFLYTAQVLYNHLYLLKEKTGASKRIIALQNIILYHSPLVLIPFLEYFH